MNNNFNIDKNKNKKTALRMLLGAIVSFFLVVCVDVILWAIGGLGTTISVWLVLLLNLVFVFSIEVILWAIGFWGTRKK